MYFDRFFYIFIPLQTKYLYPTIANNQHSVFVNKNSYI